MPVWKPINSPEPDEGLALGRRANQDRHALGLWLHPRLQIDAIRPHGNVAARRQIALLPPLIVVFPLALEPRDHCRHEVWCGLGLSKAGRTSWKSPT